MVKFTTESFGSAYSAAFFVAMKREKMDVLPADIQRNLETVNR